MLIDVCSAAVWDENENAELLIRVGLGPCVKPPENSWSVEVLTQGTLCKTYGFLAFVTSWSSGYEGGYCNDSEVPFSNPGESLIFILLSAEYRIYAYSI